MTTLLLFLALAQSKAPAPKIPLEGLDPVALVQGRQDEGDSKIFVVRGAYQYVFANAANKATFEKDPARYEIQLGGACARMGAGVGGNADTYTVYEGRIYVFGSGDCLKHFTAAPEKYLESKQAPLPALNTASDATARAKKMLARAVDAIGGAAALDGLTGIQESREANKEVRTIAYPDRLRVERTFNEKYHVQTVVLADSGFSIGPDGRSRDFDKTQATQYWRDQHRELVTLLRSRNDAAFHASAHDANSVNIEWMGDRSRLEFDPASGRAIALHYFGRGPGSAFGDIEYRYSDFRKTGDLTLPYSITTVFGDEKSPATITSIVLNPTVSADVFKRPQ